MTDDQTEARLRELMKDRYERPLPKRFYKAVSVSAENGILLDGRSVKTPMKAVLALPTRALAEAVAAEWQAQEKSINPETMPLTKYANTAIDRAVSEREAVLADFASYAGSDLVCYRAEKPRALVDLQALHWDGIIADAAEHAGAVMLVTRGVMPVLQPPEAVVRLKAAAAALDPFRLTALYNLTTLTGSALLALMLVGGRAGAEQGWTAAHVDEDYQIAEWGQDEEAMARRAGRRVAYDALLRFLALL
ncbi:MAG: ATP12 family protein [Hyphomicrobiales bacterium]